MLHQKKLKKGENMSAVPITRSDQFYVGGTGGAFHPIDIAQSGGKMLTIYTGDVIDAIQIGNDVYGRENGLKGGTVKVMIPLPEDAYFDLIKVVNIVPAADKSKELIGYIEAKINGQTVAAGNQQYRVEYGTPTTSWNIQVRVAIAGIQSGNFVNGILFQKV